MILSIYHTDSKLNVNDIVSKLNGKKNGDRWFTAKLNKYNRNEAFIMYWFYTDVEKMISADEDDKEEIIGVLKQNGKDRVLKRVYAYFYSLANTLEVYSSNEEIKKAIEDLLKVRFERMVLSSEELVKMYENYSYELNQAMFKNVNGFMYHILRGRSLENNEEFKAEMRDYSGNLRVITIKPKIKQLNAGKHYKITINGDRGTIKMGSDRMFAFRPRFEIRQITFLLFAIKGYL